jgi:hypothetical protein
LYLFQSLTRPSPHPHTLPAKPPPPATQPPVPIINVTTDDTFGKRGAGKEESVVSEEQQVGRKLSIKGQHDRDRQRRKRKGSSPLRSAGSGASTPVSAGEDGAQLSTTTMKRLKTGMDEETPSLLLRMGQHPRRVSPAAGGRNTSRSKSRSTPEDQSQRRRSNSHSSPAQGLPDLSLGISIKGAARSHSHSLLERIQGNGT